MINVQTPDGKVAAFPDNTPPEMIERVMRQTFGGPKTDVTPTRFDPTEGMTTWDKVRAGIGQGMTDAWQGATQLGAHAGAWLAEHPGLSAMLGSIQNPEITRAAATQADQEAKDKAKVDQPLTDTTAGKIGSLIGNAAVTAPIGVSGAGGVGVLAKLANAAKSGAIAGAESGLLQPVTSDDYAQAKTGQVALGAGTGAASGAALNAAGQAVEKLLPGNLTGSVINTLSKKANASDFAKEGEALAQRTGIDLTPAQISGGKSQTQLENLARQSIFSRNQAFAADQKIAQQWTDYVQNTVDKIHSGGGTPEQIGERVQGAVKNAVQDMTAKRDAAANADYGQIRTLLEGKSAIVPQTYKATLDNLLQDYSGGPQGSDYAKLSKSLGDLSENWLQNADLGTLMKTRRFLSQVAGGQVQLAGDTGRGMQKSIATKLLSAIDTDLDNASQKIGGPVGDMLQQANARYRASSQQIDGLKNSALGKLVGQDFADALGNGTFNSIPGEVVTQRLGQLKPSQIESVKQVLSQSDPETWQVVKRGILETALQKAQQAAPSEGANAIAARPGAFINALAKTPEDQARLARIFEPGEMSTIQDAMNAAKRISDKTGTNFSGTASALEGASVFSGIVRAIHADPTAIAQLGGQTLGMRSIAAIMGNSQGRAVIQQMSRLPPGSQRFRELTAQLAAIAGAQSSDSPSNGR